MGLLKWNQQKVQQLSPGELCLFIVGRVLAALGTGILLAEYLPTIAVYVGIPALAFGLLFLVIAARGLFRKKG